MRLLVAALVCVAAPVRGGTIPHPIPESERWATITHPGNEPHATGFPDLPPRPIGRVDYEYQISRTELTGAEWFEFVRAYAPYVGSDVATATQFTSNLVNVTFGGGNPPIYRLRNGADNYPARVGWRFVARYCNWLHNDKQLDQAAFESGVYDTSTFVQNPDGSWADQRTRSPGAKYWIPNEDEWIKAGFFDPHRFGPDQPGYWNYPNGTNSPLIQGRPNDPVEPGQTSAGWEFPENEPPVAAYLSVRSPWGLFDVSGSAAEWIENPFVNQVLGSLDGRLIRGTDSWFTFPPIPFYTPDYIDASGSAAGLFSTSGVRLARIVPTPGAWLGIVPMIPYLFRRTRSCGFATSQRGSHSHS